MSCCRSLATYSPMGLVEDRWGWPVYSDRRLDEPLSKLAHGLRLGGLRIQNEPKREEFRTCPVWWAKVSYTANFSVGGGVVGRGPPDHSNQ